MFGPAVAIFYVIAYLVVFPGLVAYYLLAWEWRNCVRGPISPWIVVLGVVIAIINFCVCGIGNGLLAASVLVLIEGVYCAKCGLKQNEHRAKAERERKDKTAAFAHRVGLSVDSPLIEDAYASLTPLAIDIIQNRSDLDVMLEEDAEETRKRLWYKRYQ